MDASFWSDPFGIPEFWNIAGIVVGVGGAVGGAALVARKRTALRRYLLQIDAIDREYERHPGARERALLVVERRLKEDLLRGRILDAHYAIVQRNIEQSLTKARSRSLMEGFADLPASIQMTLRVLVQDGMIDADKLHVLRAQLDADASLTPTARAEILRRVESWARDEPGA